MSTGSAHNYDTEDDSNGTQPGDPPDSSSVASSDVSILKPASWCNGLLELTLGGEENVLELLQNKSEDTLPSVGEEPLKIFDFGLCLYSFGERGDPPSRISGIDPPPKTIIYQSRLTIDLKQPEGSPPLKDGYVWEFENPEHVSGWMMGLGEPTRNESHKTNESNLHYFGEDSFWEPGETTILLKYQDKEKEEEDNESKSLQGNSTEETTIKKTVKMTMKTTTQCTFDKDRPADFAPPLWCSPAETCMSQSSTPTLPSNGSRSPS